jgi:hypothetical protein
MDSAFRFMRSLLPSVVVMRVVVCVALMGAVLFAAPCAAGEVFGEAVKVSDAGDTMMALSIDGGVLYAGGGDVLRVLDIADPRHPTLLGKVSGLPL